MGRAQRARDEQKDAPTREAVYRLSLLGFRPSCGDKEFYRDGIYVTYGDYGFWTAKAYVGKYVFNEATDHDPDPAVVLRKLRDGMRALQPHLAALDGMPL